MIVENFRPAVKDRLGVDYETIRKINPRIIYASLSGFGDTGPYRDRPGVDQIAQGMGGLMSITGLPGQGPVRVGIPICDLTAGIFLSTTVLMALYERERSGEGQWVKTSLLVGDDPDARLPGDALADRQGGAAAGRQRPPDRHSDRRVQDQGRPHEHRRLRQQAVRAAGRRARQAGVEDRSGLVEGRRAAQEQAEDERDDRRGDGDADLRRVGARSSTMPACRQDRSIRSTRCSPIRR